MGSEPKWRCHKCEEMSAEVKTLGHNDYCDKCVLAVWVEQREALAAARAELEEAKLELRNVYSQVAASLGWCVQWERVEPRPLAVAKPGDADRGVGELARVAADFRTDRDALQAKLHAAQTSATGWEETARKYHDDYLEVREISHKRMVEINALQAKLAEAEAKIERLQGAGDE